MRRISRELEERILALADDLIRAVMALSPLEGEDRASKQAEGIRMAAELAGLVVGLLEGREELLEDLLDQLTQQRLPDSRELRNLVNFAADLEEVIKKGVARFHELKRGQEQEQEGQQEQQLPVTEPEEAEGRFEGRIMPAGEEARAETVAGYGKDQGEPCTPAVHETKAEPTDPVLQALALVFPGRKVQKGYSFHGTTLSYYLPGEKLAVVLEGAAGSGKARQDYYCRKEGIKLVTLDPATAGNHWRAAQAIRQHKRSKL